MTSGENRFSSRGDSDNRKRPRLKSRSSHPNELFARTGNRQRAHLIGTILKLLLPLLCWHGVAATNEIDLLRFISNLPPIDELVFSVQRANLPPLYYFLKCQGNNYVVREATSPDNIRSSVSRMDSFDRFAGHLDGEYWTLKLFQGRGIYTHGTKARVPKNDISFTVESLYSNCTEPLRLGLPGVDFRTISWKGDASVFSGIFFNGDRYKGRIQRNDKGQIISADYGIVSDKLKRHWFLKCNYDTISTIPAGFPSAYDLSWTMGVNPERKLNSTRILSLVLATNPMPRELFQAQRFLDTPLFQENLNSNNVDYVKKGNVWEKMDLPDVEDPGSVKTFSWLFPISAVFVVLVAVGIAIQMARRTRYNPKHNAAPR
jgi:hypothetical protein